MPRNIRTRGRVTIYVSTSITQQNYNDQREQIIINYVKTTRDCIINQKMNICGRLTAQNSLVLNVGVRVN